MTGKLNRPKSYQKLASPRKMWYHSFVGRIGHSAKTINKKGMIMNEYTTIFEWPENCIIECRDNVTLVFFGESSPSYVSTFKVELEGNFVIVGRGEDLHDAEVDAKDKYLAFAFCKGHEYHRDGSPFGKGVCLHCGITKTDAFEPLENCVECGVKTDWAADGDGNPYCEAHEDLISAESFFLAPADSDGSVFLEDNQ